MNHARAASIRPPAVAGMFYPAAPDELRRTLGVLLSEAAPPAFPGTVRALVAPHAGYPYSGLTAAYAYRLLEGRSIETVVIVSPSHREYFRGISIYDGDAYRTPLGDLAIAAGLRQQLVEGDAVIEASSRGHRDEHAVEVQLPFLQSMLATAPTILPIVMGDQRTEFCRHLGTRLADVLAGQDVLLVASSDLSHYHPYDEANLLDQSVIRSLERGDAERLMDDLASDRVEACGGGPIATVLLASRALGADTVRILHHCNSGDMTGDRRSVVGYVSAAIVH